FAASWDDRPMPFSSDSWQDPAVFGINLLRGSAVISGRSRLQAADDPARSYLAGPWAFDHHRGIGGLDPVTLGHQGAAGPHIEVPGVWQLQGYGIPYYLANTYPPGIGKRASRIPDIDPDRNEIGVYTRT